MNKRIRIFGYTIGMLDEKLLEDYRLVHPYKREVVMLNSMISKQILGHDIKSREDVITAEECAVRAGYRTCGEMLENFMRQELYATRRICDNCEYFNGKCKETKGKYYTCKKMRYHY